MKRKLIFIKKYFSVARFIGLALIKSFNKKQRSNISNIYDTYVHPIDNRPWEVGPLQDIRLDSIVNPRDMANISYPEEVDGNVTLFELWVISALIRKNNFYRIFEIGTFEGRTTFNISQNCSMKAEIYTLDLPKTDIQHSKYLILDSEKKYIEKDSSGEKFKGSHSKNKIIQLYGDSATFDFSPFYNTIDLVFIDGSHSYKYVINDSLKAYSMVRNGGIIIWHDYSHQGGWTDVNKALKYLQQNEKRFSSLSHVNKTTFAYLKK